jgi:Flp pilus assembly protein TadD
MHRRIPSYLVASLFVIGLMGQGVTAQTEDPSIDRLLKKLPPPEKLAKQPVQQVLETNDPAAKDPAIKQILQAEQAHNFPRALDTARKLTNRYPNSAAAHSIRGILALRLHQFAEASSSFRTAAKIQPKLGFAHLGLALVEGSQGHFAAAIPHLQRVAELQPKAAFPVLCNERLCAENRAQAGKRRLREEGNQPGAI